MKLFKLFNFILFSASLLSFAQNDQNNTKLCESGVDHINNYQFDQAIQKLNADECLNSSRSNYYLMKLAYAYKKNGNYGKSKNTYKRLIRQDSTNTKAYFQLANIYNKESNQGKALYFYKKLIQIDSSNSYYHKKIGDVYWSQKNIKGAAMSYLKAHKLNSKNLEVISKLSNVYFKLELYEMSNQLIAKGLKENPKNVLLLKQKAKIYYAKKSYKKLIKTVHEIDQIIEKPSDYLLKLKAIALYKTDDFKQAIELFSSILKVFEETEVIHYYLGMCYQKRDELIKSEHHFEKAIDEGMSDNLASYFTNLGLVFEKQGKFKESIQAYKLAYEESNDDILLYRLAKNYDAYYADKKVALKYYKRYLDNTKDSLQGKYTDYAKKRVSSIKKEIHFDIDTLN